MVASILEVGDASKGDAPGLGGRQADVETLGLVVVGDDVLGVGVGLQGCVGQAIQAKDLVGAVHVKGGSVHGEHASGVGDVGVGGDDVSGGRQVQEVSRIGDAGERNVDFTRRQRHDVEVVAEAGGEVGHNRILIR